MCNLIRRLFQKLKCMIGQIKRKNDSRERKLSSVIKFCTKMVTVKNCYITLEFLSYFLKIGSPISKYREII